MSYSATWPQWGSKKNVHLVSAIEEGKVLLLFEDLGNLLPFISSRIDTCRVVRARVEEED